MIGEKISCLTSYTVRFIGYIRAYSLAYRQVAFLEGKDLLVLVAFYMAGRASFDDVSVWRGGGRIQVSLGGDMALLFSGGVRDSFTR